MFKQVLYKESVDPLEECLYNCVFITCCYFLACRRQTSGVSIHQCFCVYHIAESIFEAIPCFNKVRRNCINIFVIVFPMTS